MSRQQSATPSNQYRVMLDLLPEYQARPDALSMIYMKSDDGRLVPLDTLAKVTQDAGPLTIHHLGQLPSITVSFNIRPGFSLGEAVDQFTELTRNLGVGNSSAGSGFHGVGNSSAGSGFHGRREGKKSPSQ